MHSRDLYVPSAEGNPLDKRFLPKSAPDFQFPVGTRIEQGTGRFVASQLFRLWVCAALVTWLAVLPMFYAPLSQYYLPPIFIVFGIVALAFTIAYERRDRVAISVALVILAIVSGAAVRAIEPLWLAPLLVALLQGGLLHVHYVNVCSTGMHDEASQREFRRWGRLPPGVSCKSRLRGFCDALTSYLSYNHHNLRWPGVYSSTLRSRMPGLYASIAFVTVTVTPLLHTPGDPLIYLLVTGPAIVLGAWLLGSFVICAPRAGAALAMKDLRFSPKLWPGFLDRLNQSHDQLTRESIWAGFVDYDRSPILYKLADLFRHMWVVGAAGSGKTSYLLFLLYQVIFSDRVSTITIDLKGTSHELLATKLDACRVLGRRRKVNRPVQHFTPDFGEATYLFDIFHQTWWLSLPTPQRTAVLLAALSISYMAVYGQQYFRDAAYELVHFVLQRHPDISSWEDFRRRFQDALRHAKPWELSDQVRRDGEHVLLIIKRLAAVPALNDYGNLSRVVTDNRIDFSDAFVYPRHYYFSLAPGRHRLLAGEIARLVIASLLTAGATTKRRPVGVVLIIDEFQEAATRDLGLLLAQARSLGIGVVLANQTTSQLVSPDIDLRPIIEGNTALQAWMQITDDVGREQLRRLGGQQVVQLVTEQRGGRSGPSYTYSEHVEDRVSGNLVSEISSEPGRFLIRMTSNSGYACYGDLIFAARSYFHQTKDDYEKACAMPWPGPTPETLINGNPPPPPSAPPPMVPANLPTSPIAPRSGHRLGRIRP